jgi:L,D-transpeptidase catalytic domain
MINTKSFVVTVIGATLLLASPFIWSKERHLDSFKHFNLNTKYQALHRLAPELKPKVLRLALRSYAHLRERGYDRKRILTVIDYSVDSAKHRMWGFNVAHEKLLFKTLVAHGKGSGNRYAHHFSNVPHSKASSLGTFVTAGTYYGHKGLSLRLKGMEPGINNNAYRRDVVIHGARYASHRFVERIGRLGRSWGCPAVPVGKAHQIINMIKNGTEVFAYYPKWSWLHHSRYLA